MATFTNNPANSNGVADAANSILNGIEGNTFLHLFDLSDLTDGNGDIFNLGSGNDSVVAGSGNDTIRGGSGADTLAGSDGNDTIEGGFGGDRLFGGFGSDRIFAATQANSDGSTAGDSIRGGFGNDTVLGSGGSDTIFGDSGQDVLDGRGGNDLISDGTSNSTITGGSGDDTISSGNLDDRIDGGLDRDSISAGGGNDVVTGGGGQDVLTSGLGFDRFDFNALSESGIAFATRDTITDFTVNALFDAQFIDRIDVASIDARAATAGNDAFAFIGTGAFTGEGQIRAVQSGANTILEFNTTGASRAEMTIQLNNIVATAITEVDFIL